MTTDESDVKAEVRALLDRLPDDCSYADVQRGIAVLMWPKQGDGSLKPPGAPVAGRSEGADCANG